MRPSPKTVAVAVLLIGSCVSFALPADAHKPPRLQRLEAVSFARELLERFFFSKWLGEPMSVHGDVDCTDTEVRQAMLRRDRFPELFRHSGADHQQAYCRVVSVTDRVWIGPPNRRTISSFVIRSPSVTACADYAAQWRSFIGEQRLADAIKSYSIPRSRYARYGLPQRYYHGVDQPDPVFTLGQSRVLQLRIDAVREENGFCFFRFFFRSGDDNRR